MKMVLLSIGAILVFLVLCFAVVEYWTFKTPNIEKLQGANSAEKLDALNQWFDKLERQGKFNGTILFARNGSIIAQRNFGVTDKAGENRIGDRTSFNLASISKHFTAFGLLLLVRENELNFEDSIADYLPELKKFSDISVRQLLNHTSGLPDYAYLERSDLEDLAVIDMDFIFSWLGADIKGLGFDPGTQYEYSNTNYVLLAEIIARISGTSYAQFIQERIFAPLEMNDSAVVNKIINVDALFDRAYGFRKEFFYFGKPVEYDLNHLDGIAGDGNIYTSAQDFLKWNTALRTYQLLPKEFTDQLYLPTRLADGEIVEDQSWGDVTHYGIGVGWKNENNDRIYAYGGWRGFLNSSAWDLESGETFIVFTNYNFGLGTFSVFDKLELWASNYQ